MTYLDPTYREQTGPDADTGRRQSQLLESYLNNAWIAYTPTISASSGGSPAIGNGTISGKYKRLGSTCKGVVSLTVGSTTSFGTSTLQISLPFPGVGPQFRLIQGNWYGFHNATVQTAMALVQYSDTAFSTMRFVYPAGSPIGVTTAVSGSAATPWGWASGDNFDVTFDYEVAK